MAFEDRPTHRAYARTERERRFLVTELPVGVSDYERLHDLYLTGTHLRLREVRRADGTWVTSKLGQKVPSPEDPTDPRLRQMTTIYLPEDEAAVFASLPGLSTVKRRYKLAEQGLTFCIDVYENPLAVAGTMVAEVEADTTEVLVALTCPAWAVREVTSDGAWSAVALARRGVAGP